MGLADEKKELKILETKFNIKKLEVRLLELDEEKQKISDSIENLKRSLEEI
jgi:hypothetical protein